MKYLLKMQMIFIHFQMKQYFSRIIKYNTDNYNDTIHTFKNKTLKNNNKNVQVGLIESWKFCFIYSYSFN